MEVADLTADALPDDQDKEDPEIRKLEGGIVKFMIKNIHFPFFRRNGSCNVQCWIKNLQRTLH